MPSLVPWLFAYLELQDAGCPLSRHEMRDEHWRLLRKFRINWDLWRAELAAEEEARRKDNG